MATRFTVDSIAAGPVGRQFRGAINALRWIPELHFAPGIPCGSPPTNVQRRRVSPMAHWIPL
jgi:hypothetical protein